jgi:hypothetical protein
MTRRAKMALHARIVMQAGSIGIRTELNAGETYADYAGALHKRLFRQKSELLAKEELQSKGIPEGVYRKSSFMFRELLSHLLSSLTKLRAKRLSDSGG